MTTIPRFPSPLSSTFAETPNPMTDDQLVLDIDDFIQHQHQKHLTTQPLTINQLAQSHSPSETPISSIRNTPTTLAQCILMKRKHPTNPPR